MQRQTALWATFTLILVGVALGLMAGIDATARTLLASAKEQTYPLLWNPPPSTKLDPTRQIFTRFADPQLGFAHHENASAKGMEGFQPYGPEDASYIILALGGSTTDPQVEEQNWPRQLQEQLAARGYQVRVLNGGVAGYSSNQELLKLIRDGLYLRPNLVISFSGINDFPRIHSIPEHPMVHPAQRQFFQSAINGTSEPRFLPNLMSYLALQIPDLGPGKDKPIWGVSYGTTQTPDAPGQWVRNQRLMHASTGEFGILHLAVLQPILLYGTYQPVGKEIALVDELLTRWKMDKATYQSYLEDFYGSARKACGALDYCYDATALFEQTQAPQSERYKDPRHPNAQGYTQVATALVEQIQNRGWLAAMPKTKQEPKQ